MNMNTIHQIDLAKQDTTDGILMSNRTVSYRDLINLPYLYDKKFLAILHGVIREHGKYKCGDIYLDMSSSHITNSEKRDLLRFVLEKDDYDFVCESTANLNLLYEEKESLLQALADHESSVVYNEAMEESGMRMIRHPNNDEVYWVKR